MPERHHVMVSSQRGDRLLPAIHSRMEYSEDRIRRQNRSEGQANGRGLPSEHEWFKIRCCALVRLLLVPQPVFSRLRPVSAVGFTGAQSLGCCRSSNPRRAVMLLPAARHTVPGRLGRYPPRSGRLPHDNGKSEIIDWLWSDRKLGEPSGACIVIDSIRW